MIRLCAVCVCVIYLSSQVGIPGCDITESEKVFLVAELLKMKCLPVFLEARIARAAYHGYCKQVRTCYATLLCLYSYCSFLFLPSHLPYKITWLLLLSLPFFLLSLSLQFFLPFFHRFLSKFLSYSHALFFFSYLSIFLFSLNSPLFLHISVTSFLSFPILPPFTSFLFPLPRFPSFSSFVSHTLHLIFFFNHTGYVANIS
jgi:hypothetical protein